MAERRNRGGNLARILRKVASSLVLAVAAARRLLTELGASPLNTFRLFEVTGAARHPYLVDVERTEEHFAGRGGRPEKYAPVTAFRWG